jgi:hypothetical protein
MAGIFNKLWLKVHRDHAGRRFQDHYDATHAARKDARWSKRAMRVLRILVAMVATAIGLILAFIPGPAIPFFILAGGLLSAESRSIARLLDWGEVRLWTVWGWARRLPVAVKYSVTAVVASLGFAVAYASYRFMTS